LLRIKHNILTAEPVIETVGVRESVLQLFGQEFLSRT